MTVVDYPWREVSDTGIEDSLRGLSLFVVTSSHCCFHQDTSETVKGGFVSIAISIFDLIASNLNASEVRMNCTTQVVVNQSFPTTE
jgi:hypothetical protein